MCGLGALQAKWCITLNYCMLPCDVMELQMDAILNLHVREVSSGCLESPQFLTLSEADLSTSLA